MSRTKNWGWLLFLLFLTCQSPEGPERKPSEPTFSLRYVVQGLRTPEGALEDSTVKAVELEAVTYFPKQDYSWYQMRNFQSYQFEAELFLSVPDPVYAGCEREFQLKVAKDWDTTDIFIEWKIFHFPRDTISGPADSVFRFIWPTDTAKADTVYLYP